MILTKNNGNGTAAISTKEIMERASAEKWAVGGYNMHNPETTQALLRADRKSTRLNSSHSQQSRMPSSA